MKKKLPTYLLVLFVAFIILQDATAAGTQANRFFGWLFDGVGVAGEFVASVFDSDDDGDGGPQPTPTVTETVTVEPTDPSATVPPADEPNNPGTDGG